MVTIKTETEHLSCTRQKDEKGQHYYKICDKESNKPLILYIDINTIKISDDIDDVTKHPYFKEMCCLIQGLMDEEIERFYSLK